MKRTIKITDKTKVVHLPSQTYDDVKSYCEANGVKLTWFLNKAAIEALELKKSQVIKHL